MCEQTAKSVNRHRSAAKFLRPEKPSLWLIVLSFCAALLLGAPSLRAQNVNATVLGTVSDSSQAAVPRATVTAVQVATNARPFFQTERTPIRYNQFGFVLSGPVRLPGPVFGPLGYDGRDRTFFLVNYEGLRERNPAQRFLRVPTAAERRGDFSALSYQLYDPVTPGAQGLRTPFAGNVIPRNRWNPFVEKVLAFYPEPNIPLNERNQNYTVARPNRFDADQFTTPGYGLADFLLGFPNQIIFAPTLPGIGKAPNLLTASSYAGYIQDDWKVASRLTLNLGLRYELNLPPVEDNNRTVIGAITPDGIVKYPRDLKIDDKFLPPQFSNPVVVDGKSIAAGQYFRRVDTRQIWQTDKNNFQPRIGLSFRPFNTDNTVVRAGYAIFNGRQVGLGAFAVGVGAPFLNQTEARQDQTIAPSGLRFGELPPGSFSPEGVRAFSGVPEENPDSFIQNWTLSIQQQLGLLMIFNTITDTVDCELAWSADTERWERVCPGSPLIPLGARGAYDGGCVYAAATPVFLPNEIRLYYGGGNGPHSNWRDGFFCLARLRPDGFAALEPVADRAPAVVTTRPVLCAGRDLRVSADAAGGALRVGVPGAEGLSLDRCRPVTADVSDGSVRWRGGDLARLQGRTVQLQFELRSARLYSFSFA